MTTFHGLDFHHVNIISLIYHLMISKPVRRIACHNLLDSVFESMILSSLAKGLCVLGWDSISNLLGLEQGELNIKLGEPREGDAVQPCSPYSRSFKAQTTTLLLPSQGCWPG